MKHYVGGSPPCVSLEAICSHDRIEYNSTGGKDDLLVKLTQCLARKSQILMHRLDVPQSFAAGEALCLNTAPGGHVLFQRAAATAAQQVR